MENLKENNLRYLETIKNEANGKIIEFYQSEKKSSIHYLSADDLLYVGDLTDFLNSFQINEFKIIDWELMDSERYLDLFKEEIDDDRMLVVIYKDYK